MRSNPKHMDLQPTNFGFGLRWFEEDNDVMPKYKSILY